MDPAQFFSASRVVIVAGKGGVGKTVVSAALARAAAAAGFPSTILEVAAQGAVAASFDQPPFGYHDVELLAPKAETRAIHGRAITPDEALVEYLEDHGLRRLARRLAATGVLEAVATATPGIKDLLVMGKVKQLEQAGGTGVLIVDAPASGHAVNFLDAARVLFDTAKVGPIHHQAADVLALLRDPDRCQVMLVALAEETPINELVETAYRLEDQVGVALGPVIINGVLPTLPGIDRDPAGMAPDASKIPARQLTAMRDAARWWCERQARQRQQLDRLADTLPLPQILLPHVFTNAIGSRESVVLAEATTQGVHGLVR